MKQIPESITRKPNRTHYQKKQQIQIHNKDFNSNGAIKWGTGLKSEDATNTQVHRTPIHMEQSIEATSIDTSAGFEALQLSNTPAHFEALQ